VRREAGDWTGAEAAARGVLALDPRHADGLAGLGYALFRQDRNSEAAEVLQSALELADNPTSRSALARIRKTNVDERGMKEQRLAHFHLRYDGEAHEDVGREILRALERHYSTLVSALDYEPQTTIPVILFTQDQFVAAGAPQWAGGIYDSTDGRIRVPIGGLTTSLTAEIDETLIHELTHAFIAERTRGVATREIQEGVAQLMEGKRIERLLSAEELAALADGRFGGLHGFYMGALAFAEYLGGLRGQSGINDLLKAMGETGNPDLAFQQVYGDTYQATRRAWMARMRQRYGK
jgi:tetratricopeptide (TPR) repeat protein